jgi:DNA processing protein
MSQGVLVTEGAQDSGSLITANFALDFGRKVFAVPGPVTSSLSAAPLKLIEKGARLVISPEDIMRELNVKSIKSKAEEPKFKNLTKVELRIVQLIENESLPFDEIARRLKIDPSKLGTILSMMEIKDLIKSSGGSYGLAKSS